MNRGMPEKREGFVHALKGIIHRHTDASIARDYDRSTFTTL